MLLNNLKGRRMNTSVFHDYDHYDFKQRLSIGKLKENQIADCLSKHYGFKLNEVSDKEDIYEKIDRHWVQEDGSVKKVQIKTRTKSSGNDILLDIFEPFFGIKNDKTKPGRDMKGSYDIYICLDKHEKVIRVIDGKRQKEVVEEVLQEWADADYQLRV